MFKPIIFVILASYAQVDSLEENELKLFRPIQGYKFVNNSFYYVRTIVDSDLQCGIKCLDSEFCASFSYSNSTGRCLISSIFANGPGALLTDQSFDHFQYETSALPENVTLSWRYQPRVIFTPNYPYMSFYNNSFYVRLLVPQGYSINLLVSTFNIEGNYCNMSQEGVIFDEGDTALTQKLHLCSSNKTRIPFIFKTDENILQVRTKSTLSRILFKARYFYVRTDKESHNCELLSCPVNSKCITEEFISSCECFEGYTGRHCIFDPCFLDPCLNNGTCIRINDNAKCLCSDNYTGNFCEVELDPCSSNPCINGLCISKNNTKFNCDCFDGFSGLSCETNIDDCASNPCLSLECVDGVNRYYCRCSNCIHGLCLYKNGQPFCWCFPGYTGANCLTNRNECLSNPCVYGNCTDHSDGYECTCERGYFGRNCENYESSECNINLCHKGKCLQSISGEIRCICPFGFTGKYCEHAFDWCQQQCLDTCLNTFSNITYNKCFQKCRLFCLNSTENITVTETTGTVPTTTGYIASTTVTEKHNHGSISVTEKHNLVSLSVTNIYNTCRVNCINGECITLNGGYVCRCSEGFAGVYCNDVLLPCPCVHGTCLNNTTITCLCEPEYTGMFCDTKPNIRQDHCEKINCVNGRCKNGDCICNTQFTGRFCETPLNITHVECEGVSCHTNEEDTFLQSNTVAALLAVVAALVVILLILGALLVYSKCTNKRGSFTFNDSKNPRQASYPRLIDSRDIYNERNNRNYLTTVPTIQQQPNNTRSAARINQAYDSFRRSMENNGFENQYYSEDGSNQSLRTFNVDQNQNDEISIYQRRHQTYENSVSDSSESSDPYDFPPSPRRQQRTLINDQAHDIEGVETGKSEV